MTYRDLLNQLLQLTTVQWRQEIVVKARPSDGESLAVVSESLVTGIVVLSVLYPKGKA